MTPPADIPACPDPRAAGTLRRELLYDRREEILELRDVRRAGMAFFGDSDGIALYGRAAGDWYAAGVRLTGAMCVQATVDHQSVRVANAVRECLGRLPSLGAVGLVDLFAGTCNLILHIGRALDAIFLGIEKNQRVAALTRANFAALRMPPPRLRQASWKQYFDDPLTGVDTTVFVLDPPWGDGFSFTNGLDLRGTRPAVMEVLQYIAEHDRAPQRYCVVRIPLNQRVEAGSVRTITDRYRLLASAPGCLVFNLRQAML